MHSWTLNGKKTGKAPSGVTPWWCRNCKQTVGTLDDPEALKPYRRSNDMSNWRFFFYGIFVIVCIAAITEIAA